MFILSMRKTEGMPDCFVPEQCYDAFVNAHKDFFPAMTYSRNKRCAFGKIGSLEYDASEHRMSFSTAIARGRISLGGSPRPEVMLLVGYDVQPLCVENALFIPKYTVSSGNRVAKQIIDLIEEKRRLQKRLEIAFEMPARHWHDLDEFIIDHFVQG
jgi:hypothetical protein